MCGICGIVDFQGRPIGREAVDRMRDVMIHRGPDAAGTQILPYVALGHRRLSIIDLSPRGHQPMANEDDTVWVVFNGEIYDFMELRSDLEAVGHRFRSDSDTEVLVHGYEQWGIERLLERINGMFAFALWDVSRRTLVLARDRLGKKPVYYGTHDGRFLFSSDIKSLWTYDPAAWRVRLDSVARFLYWTYFPGRESVYENIYALLPAHYLVVRESGLEERRYWRLSFSPKYVGSLAETIERTDDVVARAVRRRLRSDVPLGAFLSGGVDSSYVVSCMDKGGSGPVRTFCIGTEDRDHDEREYAQIVSRHCRTEHTEYQVSADAWSVLLRLVWEFGQPFGDAAVVPTYYVAKCAREHVTVALTGDGGDESFAGYSHHQGRHMAALLGRLVPSSTIDALLLHGRRLLDSGVRRHPVPSATRFLRYAHPDPLVCFAPVTCWTLHHLKALWATNVGERTNRDTLLGYASAAAHAFDGVSPLDAALHFDLNVLLPFCYNVKVDVATMMTSLEARSPFQDREVVEWAARIDPLVKSRYWEKKHLLKRAAARRVPREVIYRPKHGFSMPMDRWFLGPWAREAHEIILGRTARERGLFRYEYIERLWQAHQAKQERHGTRFWLLLWLELWFRMFVDRTLGPRDTLPTNVAAAAAR